VYPTWPTGRVPKVFVSNKVMRHDLDFGLIHINFGFIFLHMYLEFSSKYKYDFDLIVSITDYAVKGFAESVHKLCQVRCRDRKFVIVFTDDLETMSICSTPTCYGSKLFTYSCVHLCV
jgi:hypothetical protein